MEAAVGGERVVEAGRAAVEAVLVGTSVRHRVASEGDGNESERRNQGRRTHRWGVAAPPVVSGAPQAAVAAGLAVDAAGFASG